MEQAALGIVKTEMELVVFRINWSRRPKFVPKFVWLFLGKWRVPFVGDIERIVVGENNNGSVTSKVQ